MIFVHKALSLPWYHNVSYVTGFTDWWNRNFQSILVKNFYNMNFNDWSNTCTCGNSCQCSSFRIRSRIQMFSTQRNEMSPSVVIIRSNFVAISSYHKMLEEGFFTSLCHMYLLFQCLEANTLPCILFPGAWVGGDTNSSTSSGSTMVKILLSTGIPTRPFSSSVKPNW